MVQPTIGFAVYREIETFTNKDTVVILAGTPVFMKGGTNKEIITGVAANAAAFVGIASEDIAINASGPVIVRGFANARFPAVTTGSLWASVIPTVGSAGVYSFVAGAATALTAHIILSEALIAGSVEDNRGRVFIKRA